MPAGRGRTWRQAVVTTPRGGTLAYVIDAARGRPSVHGPPSKVNLSGNAALPARTAAAASQYVNPSGIGYRVFTEEALN